MYIWSRKWLGGRRNFTTKEPQSPQIWRSVQRKKRLNIPIAIFYRRIPCNYTTTAWLQTSHSYNVTSPIIREKLGAIQTLACADQPRGNFCITSRTILHSATKGLQKISPGQQCFAKGTIKEWSAGKNGVTLPTVMYSVQSTESNTTEIV